MAATRIKGITIEIGGDTTKLTKALSQVDSAINRTQQNLRDINKALKFDPGNTTLLKDKQVELAKQIEATEQRIKEEKIALEQLNEKLDQPFDLDHAEEFQKNAKAAEELKLQIDLDTAALKDLEDQARQSASVLGTQMQLAGQKIQEVGQRIKSVGDQLVNIGSQMTTYVTTPIVGGFAAAIKTTAEFDAQMSKVQAISGATGDEIGQLRDKAREMGEQSKYSATEAGQAFEYMGMAGWKTADMIEGVSGIMNLAAASGEELGTTADIVTDALTAFGLEAKDAGRFADVLAAAATNSNTNVSMLGESFKYVAPAAGALGYSIEDVSIALGLMANSGIKADMAGTSLRNMFQNMVDPTKKSQAAMDRLGLTLQDDEGKMLSFRDIMDQLRLSFSEINMTAEEYDTMLDSLDRDLESGAITQKKYNDALEELNRQAFGAEGAEKARAAAMLGGTRAMSGLLAIANATEADYKKLTSAIDNSSQSFAKLKDGSVVPLSEALASGQEVMETYSGQAEAMSAQMMDNLQGDITVIISKLQELAISFGELLMPKIREITAQVSAFIDKLNSLDDSEKEQIIQIAAIVAAIGPALLIVGKITSGLGSIVTVVGQVVSGVGSLLTSFGGLSGVLTALTGPIGIVVAAVAAFAAGVAYLYTTSESFRNTVNTLAGTIRDNFGKAMQEIGPKIDELGQRFQSFMTTLQPIFEVILALVVACVNGIIGAIGPIVDFISGIVEVIMGIIQAFFSLFTGDWEGFWAGIETIIDGAVNIIKGIMDLGTSVWNNIVSTFGVKLKNNFKEMWEKVKSTVIEKIENIKQNIEDKWNYIKEWIATTLTNIWDKFKEIFSNIVDSVSQKIADVRTSIEEGMENAIEYLASLPSRFFDWGRDMISSLIDGIRDMIGDLADAAAEVADTIAEYIHFSTPDVGPLAKADTFMPDFINLLTKGINQGIPQIQHAMDSLTSEMTPQIGVGGAGGPVTINMTINGAEGQDVRLLAQYVEDSLVDKIYSRGAAFA